MAKRTKQKVRVSFNLTLNLTDRLTKSAKHRIIASGIKRVVEQLFRANNQSPRVTSLEIDRIES